MGRPSSVTPELIARIANLRKTMGANQVARLLGIGRVTVDRYETGEDGYAQTFHDVDPRHRPAASDVMARLAEIPPDTRCLTARLLGDPVFERSALARRQSSGAHGS
jgi:transcriptional regulator with XRE-family HTH domain